MVLNLVAVVEIAQGMAVHVLVEHEPGIPVEPAVFDGAKPLRHPGQEIPIVGDDDIGFAEPAENAHNAVPGLGIEAVGGLVEEQHLGFHGPHSGQGYKLFFPARKLVRQPVPESVQAEQGQSRLGGLPGRSPGQAPVEGAKGHVIEHRGEMI